MRGSEFAELAAFVAVAQDRSFRRAAVRLGLSPSALSHTIRAIETRLGTRLLNRTTRSVALTDAGTALLARVAPALEDLRGAVDAASSAPDHPAGTVRLNLPKVAAILLAPKFARFAIEQPAIRLEVRTEDGMADIVAGGFDAGVRPGEMLQADMVAVRVSPDLRLAVVGSPGYLAEHRAPRTPRDLSAHLCIGYRFAHSGAIYRWSFTRGSKTVEVAAQGALNVDDPELSVAAALHGAGLAYTLEDIVTDHLASGRLVRVLADWCPTLAGFHLYYPGRRQLPPPLRALVEFLRWREPGEEPPSQPRASRAQSADH